jgi:hypothetical protein
LDCRTCSNVRLSGSVLEHTCPAQSF